MGDYKRITQRRRSLRHARETGDPLRPWPARRTKEREQLQLAAASIIAREGGQMVFRIRYQVRGEWTCVDVYRLDIDTAERGCGHILFKSAEWAVLYARLGQKGTIGTGGIFEVRCSHDKEEDKEALSEI